MTENAGVRRSEPNDNSEDRRSANRATVPEYAPEPGQVEELVVELAPRKSALNTLMEMVETFGAAHSVPEAAVYRVNLELDELLTNYVVHRRPSDVPAKMVVRVRLVDRRLVLVVADTGPPFDPQTVDPLPDPAGDAVETVGGAGLHLVRSYADRIHYSEVDGCNILRLEHDLNPEPEGSLS